MKNKGKWAVILTIVLIFGFTVLGCAEEDKLEGTLAGHLTISGLEQYIGYYMDVYMGNLTKSEREYHYYIGHIVIIDPELPQITSGMQVFDLYHPQASSFNPNGAYAVNITILKTNNPNGSEIIANNGAHKGDKPLVKFTSGNGSIEFVHDPNWSVRGSIYD